MDRWPDFRIAQRGSQAFDMVSTRNTAASLAAYAILMHFDFQRRGELPRLALDRFSAELAIAHPDPILQVQRVISG